MPGKWTKPVWVFGPKGADGQHIPTSADAMYTCPRAAIPDWVTDLLHLWWVCRLMKAMPQAGGFLDQPLVVQAAFPFFESMHQAHGGGGSNPETAAAMAAAGAMRLLLGGGK